MLQHYSALSEPRKKSPEAPGESDDWHLQGPGLTIATENYFSVPSRGCGAQFNRVIIAPTGQK